MRLALLSLAVLFVPAASAQIGVDVRLGLNSSTIFFSEPSTVDTGARLGIVGGVGATYSVTPLFGARAEVLYSQKGSTQEVPQGTVTSKIDYVEVPLLAQVTIPAVDHLDLAVVAGPAISFKASSGISCDFTCTEGEDRLKSTNVSGVLGVSAASGPFGADVRFTRGFGSVFPDGDPVFGDTSVNYNVLSVSGVYRFGR